MTMTGACDRKPSSGFSGAASVVADLSNPDPEPRYEEGIEHRYWARDGKTSFASGGGLNCRFLKSDGSATAYAYFAIDPAFKKQDAENVLIEVEYFDDVPARLGLDYDAKGKNKESTAYTRTETLQLGGSKTWQWAAFPIRGAAFANMQNSKSDFRLAVDTQLHVRSVSVTRESHLGETGARFRNGKDFARAGFVEVLLGEPRREYEGGLQHVYYAEGSRTITTNMDGIFARHLERQGGAVGFFYFRLDPTFKKGEIENVDVEVEFFDKEPGALGIEFDASLGQETINPVHRNSFDVKHFTGSKSWNTAKIALRGASFRNAQKNGCDFRVWVTSPQVSLRRVAVARTKPPAQRSPRDFSSQPELRLEDFEDRDFHAGLLHLNHIKDGLTLLTNGHGSTGIHLRRPSHLNGYIYFQVDPSFKREKAADYMVEVEFYDRTNGVLMLEYDASTDATGKKAYVASGQAVTLRNSQSWATASFQLPGATFRHAQNSGADFRLNVKPADLFVRRVILKRASKNSPK